MASFKIHEDSLPIQNKNDMLKKSKIPKKTQLASKAEKEIQHQPNEKRAALQSFHNGVRQANKRIKIGNSKENIKPSNETMKNHTKKVNEEFKKQTDTNLFQIENIEENDSSISNFEKSKKDKNYISSLSSKSAMLNFVAYSDDILEYLKQREHLAVTRSSYMDKQPHISWKMRSTLVNWLVCVADEYKMSEDALYLGVNYIDRFLSKVSVIREKLQLVGASAMFVAGKIEEIYPPEAKEWVYLTGDSYTIRQLLKMEQMILKILDYNLTLPTAYTFLRKLCADYELDEKTTYFAMFLSELVLIEGKSFLNYKPSEIAAASIFQARINLLEKDFWPQKLEKSTGYNVKHLSPIVKAQNETFKDLPNKVYSNAVMEKYRSPKYGGVALMKPRNIDFDVLERECDVETLSDA